jgi:hypothetical protein
VSRIFSIIFLTEKTSYFIYVKDAREEQLFSIVKKAAPDITVQLNIF